MNENAQYAERLLLAYMSSYPPFYGEDCIYDKVIDENGVVTYTFPYRPEISIAEAMAVTISFAETSVEVRASYAAQDALLCKMGSELHRMDTLEVLNHINSRFLPYTWQGEPDEPPLYTPRVSLGQDGNISAYSAVPYKAWIRFPNSSPRYALGYLPFYMEMVSEFLFRVLCGEPAKKAIDLLELILSGAEESKKRRSSGR